MPRNLSKPAYLLHKSTGQARVRIAGRDHYLGTYGSADSRQRYEQLVTEWLAGRDPQRVLLTIDDLALMFLEFADGYYRHPDGTPTGGALQMRVALVPTVKLFGTTLVSEFGPLKLKGVRDEMIRIGWCRTNINRHIHRVKRVFAWGVENELVPESVLSALRAVAALRPGRTAARESEPVIPVDEGTVSQTLTHLPRTVAAMVRLQLLTGMRPGEVCAIRPCDIAIGKTGVWTYRPQTHKTQHRGKQRRVFFGPQAQDILRPFLDRDPEAYCFSPGDSEGERNSERRKMRRSPMLVAGHHLHHGEWRMKMFDPSETTVDPAGHGDSPRGEQLGHISAAAARQRKTQERTHEPRRTKSVHAATRSAASVILRGRGVEGGWPCVSRPAGIGFVRSRRARSARDWSHTRWLTLRVFWARW